MGQSLRLAHGSQVFDGMELKYDDVVAKIDEVWADQAQPESGDSSVMKDLIGCTNSQQSRADKPRILQVVDHLAGGGHTRFVLDITRGLSRIGWDVSLCVLRGPGDFYSEAQELGIPIWCLQQGPPRGRGWNAWHPRQFINLVKLLRRERFDLVHLHGKTAPVYGPVAARMARVPHVVAHDHDDSPVDLRRRVWLAADWVIQHLVDRVVAVSESVAAYRRQTHRALKGKLLVFPNFTDLSKIRDYENARQEIREELGLSEKTLVVGTVGRLAPQKGHSVLLDAMAALLHNRPETVLLLVGDGPLRQTLENQADTLSIADQVCFTGWRSDPLRVIAGMDLFVLPSFSEGLPLVMLEAMAMGKPVVASDVGGIGEVISSDELGFLVPRNEPVALAHAIDDLLADHGRREAIGAAAKRRVEECYSLDVAVTRMECLYNELMGAKPHQVVQGLVEK